MDDTTKFGIILYDGKLAFRCDDGSVYEIVFTPNTKSLVKHWVHTWKCRKKVGKHNPDAPRILVEECTCGLASEHKMREDEYELAELRRKEEREKCS